MPLKKRPTGMSDSFKGDFAEFGKKRKTVKSGLRQGKTDKDSRKTVANRTD
jgi:hypothetical protein